jgi:hypothetical protein
MNRFIDKVNAFALLSPVAFGLIACGTQQQLNQPPIVVPVSGLTQPTIVQSSMGPNTGSLNTDNPWGAITSSNPYHLPLTYPTTSGNVLLVLALTTYSTGPSMAPPLAVTDSQGDSFTYLVTNLDTGNNTGLYVYCASGIVAGSTWVQAAPADTSLTMGYTSLGYIELSHATCNLDGSSVQASQPAATMATGSFTTVTAGDFVLGVFAQTGAGQFDSVTPGGGYRGINYDLFDGVAGAWAEEYQVQTSAGPINPSMGQTSNGAWMATGLALKPGTGGVGPGAFSVLNTFWASNYNPSANLPSDFPIHGNLVVFQYDDWNSVIAVSDSAGLKWHQVGNTCDSDVFPSGAWYAVNTGGPIELDQINITLSHTSTWGTATYFVATFFDIQGAFTTNPIDTGIGTGGLICAAGDQANYDPNITWFTFAPSQASEIVLVHANQAYNDSIGTSSPADAQFLSPTILNTGNFNFTFDESANESICQNCSGSLTWTGTYNHAPGQGAVGAWEAIGMGINHP